MYTRSVSVSSEAALQAAEASWVRNCVSPNLHSQFLLERRAGAEQTHMRNMHVFDVKTLRGKGVKDAKMRYVLSSA